MVKTTPGTVCNSSVSFSGNKRHFKYLLLIVFNAFLFIHQAFGQKGYFQQKLDYNINVQLDDVADLLNGNIVIKYTNNSPDTLHYIWMHLWPNGYKNRNSALCKQMVEDGDASLYFAQANDRGFIDSVDFSVDERKVKMEFDSLNSDLCRIFLNNPLTPGSKIVITTPFRVKIPNSKFSRLGHTGDAFYISQWYPKPAVYDKEGWHPIPYLNQGEFYSEFGNFEVTVSLPENYVIGATGVLQNESEIQWLKEKNRLTAQMYHFSESDSFPLSSSIIKTITFKQDSIHDFAWFADKRFNVLSSEVTIPATGRKIITNVFFTNKKAERWLKTNDFISKGILFLSEEVGAYPYSSFSVIDGTIAAGGGMEYPMITIINSPGDIKIFELTVFHELCHNWFYGILASNERANGWMDEGITTWYELKYSEKFLNGKMAGNNNLSGSTGLLGNITGFNDLNSEEVLNLTYKFSSFNNSDQPINTFSTKFTSVNYATVMYTKTGIAFNFLNDYLGDSLFKSCMRSYFNSWKFKHPAPTDIQSSFEQTSAKKLDWFFEDLLSTTQPIRFKPEKSTGSSIQLVNQSDVAIPVKIEDEKGNSIWVEGFRDTTITTLPFQGNKFIYLNKNYATLFKSYELPYKMKCMSKKLPCIKLKPIYQVEDKPETETLYLLPAVAWNNYDKWMAGIHLSNMDLIPEHFEFYAIPMYDFLNNSITGIAGIDYNLWPLTGPFREIKFSVRSKRFAYSENSSTDNEFSDKYPVFFYSKLAPGVNFTLRKKNARSSLTQSFGYRNISVWLDEVEYTPVDSTYLKSFTTTLLNYNELTWQLINTRTIDPFSLFFKAEQGKEHVKLQVEFNYRFSYKKHNKGIDIRFFAGGFALNKTTDRNYNFNMAGWDGSQDYLFDETYFGRTDDENIWSRQFLIRDGGFKTPTNVGETNKWLAAVNLSVDIPAPLPVKFFFDLGTYEGITTTFEDINSRFMYSGGVALTPIRDVFEIYFPLFESEAITTSFEANNITKFADKIRFVFNINKLTPLNIRDRTIQKYQ